jgi:predicted alpha/beta superfamily hydrolase
MTTSLGGAAALGLTGQASAADAGFKKSGGPWALRNSEAFEYHSKIVGDTMAIGVWSPPVEMLARSKQQNTPLDIVYVLDGSFALNMAAGTCLLQYVDLINPGFPPVLLVGLDYPIGAMNARSRDYTMVDSVYPPLLPALKDIPQPGGADKFLAFIEQEVDPYIRANYKTSNKPAGLLGDSWGGTLAFYAFLKQSKLFDRYWLGSPGIFTTSTDYVAQFEARLKSKLVHPTKMFLTIGSGEVSGGVEMYEDMGRQFKRIQAALEKVPNDRLAWSSKIYEGYTHTSVVAPALNDALLRLYHK